MISKFLLTFIICRSVHFILTAGTGPPKGTFQILSVWLDYFCLETNDDDNTTIYWRPIEYQALQEVSHISNF